MRKQNFCSLLSIGCSVLVLVSAGASVAHAYPYGAAVNYATAITPGTDAVSGDFDNDGDQDVAVYHDSAGAISVLLNDGNGIFTVAQYSVGTTPGGITAIDLDGDGFLDLVTPNAGTSDNVSVLINDGDGTFAAAVNYATGNGSTFMVGTGDLDGDSDQDLIVPNYDAGTFSILLNAGDGTFAAAVNYSASTTPNMVIVGDLDGDSDRDVAVSHAGSAVMAVYLNDGDGSFADGVGYGVAGNSINGMMSGDFDGDGDTDFAIPTNSTDFVSVLLNNGDGTFATSVDYAVGDAPRRGVSVDLDGDGDLDLAVPNHTTGSVSVLVGNGNGTFEGDVQYTVQAGAYEITPVDLDGDGDLDLAVPNRNANTISVLLNDGDATFAAEVSYAVGTSPRDVVAADFDGDGDYDFAVPNRTSGTVSILFSGNAAMSPTDVEPVSLIKGIIGEVEVTFTTQSAIPLDGKIVVVFPEEFDLNNSDSVSCSTMDGSFAISVSAQTVTITRSAGSAEPAGAQACTIQNVINPTSTGQAGSYQVRTTTSADVIIERNANVSGDTFRSSGIAEQVALEPVTDVRITSGEDGHSAILQWVNPSSQGFVGVRVYRSSLAGAIGELVKETASTSHVDSNLSVGVTYYYHFQPYNSLGQVLADPTEYEFSLMVPVPGTAPVTPTTPSTPATSTPSESTPATSPTLPAGIVVGDLITGNASKAVYQVGTDGKRRVFPNEAVFMSWYADFSNVKEVPAEVLAALPLGKNMTMKPGVYLVKIVSDPKVYAIEAENVLRWVPSESLARSLYGDLWANRLRDIDDTLFNDYVVGDPI